MARVLRVKNDRGGWHGWKIWCPACRGYHVFSTEEPNEDGARWWFDGDLDRPTFRPSMREWDGAGAERRVCHSSVREGWIRYHADSTHALAGQTVRLPQVGVADREDGEGADGG